MAYGEDNSIGGVVSRPAVRGPSPSINQAMALADLPLGEHQELRPWPSHCLYDRAVQRYRHIKQQHGLPVQRRQDPPGIAPMGFSSGRGAGARR